MRNETEKKGKEAKKKKEKEMEEETRRKRGRRDRRREVARRGIKVYFTLNYIRTNQKQEIFSAK